MPNKPHMGVKVQDFSIQMTCYVNGFIFYHIVQGVKFQCIEATTKLVRRAISLISTTCVQWGIHFCLPPLLDTCKFWWVFQYSCQCCEVFIFLTKEDEGWWGWIDDQRAFVCI
jgi:hypothetical protein